MFPSIVIFITNMPTETSDFLAVFPYVPEIRKELSCKREAKAETM